MPWPLMPCRLLSPSHALQLLETDAINLDVICRQHGVRLLLLRSYGLVSLSSESAGVGWGWLAAACDGHDQSRSHV